MTGLLNSIFFHCSQNLMTKPGIATQKYRKYGGTFKVFQPQHLSSQKSAYIRRIRKFLSSDAVQTVVNALALWQVDYCNSILFGLPNTELQKLQRVQNVAARLICNTNNFDHITPTLVKLHWLPVKYCINFKILLITFKAIHGLAPKYLTHKNKCNYNLISTVLARFYCNNPG